MNCFNLEEQPHWSTKESTLPTCSRGPPVDPMGKDLNLRPLGKKSIHAFHFARGVTTARLTLNLCASILMFVSFNLSMGQAVGKLLGRFAGSDWGLKRKRARLAQFLPKPKLKATLESDASKGVGPVSMVILGCSPRPKFTSSAIYGVVLGPKPKPKPSLQSVNSKGGGWCRRSFLGALLGRSSRRWQFLGGSGLQAICLPPLASFGVAVSGDSGYSSSSCPSA